MPVNYTGNFGVAPMPTYGTGALAPSAPVAQTPSMWNRMGNFAASPTGAALINAGGSYLATKGMEDQAEKDRALRAQQQSNDARLQIARDMQLRAESGTNRPIGEAQNFTNRQMLAAAVASGLFSGGFQIPGPAGARFKPMPVNPAFTQSLTDPTAVKAATAQSIQNRESDLLSTNPNIAQTHLGTLGLPQSGAMDPRISAMDRGQQLWNSQNQLWEDSLGNQKLADMAKLTGKPIDPKTGLPKGYELDKNGQLKKKSFWDSGWGKAIKIGALGAGTIATMGAASPLLAAGIAAGSGAFQGATSGGGLKGALLGAGLGAATGGFGGGVGGAAAKGLGRAALTTTAKTMLKDPRFYANVAPSALSIVRS
jgi:hypothetical protein